MCVSCRQVMLSRCHVTPAVQGYPIMVDATASKVQVVPL